MLLTITRWWHCRLCHHEVQLSGAWPNTLCTQRRPCAWRPVCLLCQYAPAASPPSSPPPRGTAGGVRHTLPSSVYPEGLLDAVSKLCASFLLSLWFIFLKNVFLLPCHVHIPSVELDEFLPAVLPASHKPTWIHSSGSPPARVTSSWTSNIEETLMILRLSAGV